MDYVLHVIERELIHAFSAATVFMLVYSIDGRLESWRHWQKVRAGIVAAFFLFLREPYDVAKGGWLWKSYIDIATWSTAMFGAYFLMKRFNRWRKRRGRAKVEVRQ